MLPTIYFSLFGIIAILCALGVLVVRHPITGAVNLVGVMLSLAGIYAVLSGPFLGIVQILVYAGAIMMLVVFVIMVVNGARDSALPRAQRLRLFVLALPVVLVLLLLTVLSRVDLPASGHRNLGTVEAIATEMFSFAPGGGGYYLLFEVIGLVLLTALTGAVLLAKRDLGGLVEAEAEASAAVAAADRGEEAGHG